MTLKSRMAIYISVLFSIVFGITMLVVYFQFSEFRKEEFKDRLEQNANKTIKLIVEAKELDEQLFRLIDRNSIQKLFKEKTLIFDENYELIYSSVDDEVIKWSKNDLIKLKKDGAIYEIQHGHDIYGLYVNTEGKDFYILVSALDKYGLRKIQYLSYLLILTYIFGTSMMWMITFYFVRSLIAPLDVFQKKITQISENNLTERLVETGMDQELSLMAHGFNQMMMRLEKSYIKQKEFTSNASHELRTPVARIISQLDNLERINIINHVNIRYIKSINQDATQMADLISSLLLLSQMDETRIESLEEIKRIDEIIFDSSSLVRKDYHDFQLNFSLIEPESFDLKLDVLCNESLLKIAFFNLFKNAYLYSEDRQASVEIKQREQGWLILEISNNGETLNLDEQNSLFSAFMRGKNSINKSGTGLGLRIAQRILRHHQATIEYEAIEGRNIFTIRILV